MAQAIPSAADCCVACEDTVSVAVPGAQGATGAAGVDGINGINAVCTTTAQFTMPNKTPNPNTVTIAVQ